MSCCLGREGGPSMILSDSSQMTYLKYIQAAGASYVLRDGELSFFPWVEKLTQVWFFLSHIYLFIFYV